MAEPMNAADRRLLLDQCLPAMRRLGELQDIVGPAAVAVKGEIRQISDSLRSLWSAYIDRLPVVPLSRCPFTRALWSLPFDSFGLDGPWWNYHQPLRRLDGPAPPHYLSLRGAVKPAEELPDAPFLAVPGPEKPFVIRRLLELPGVKAVISHVRVGDMDAYPIVYFAARPLPDDERTNDWGTSTFQYIDERGGLRQGEGFDGEDMFDYQLGPWIDAGKVLWTAPRDMDFELREGTRDCPYLELPGKQAVWRLRDGQMWHGPVVE